MLKKAKEKVRNKGTRKGWRSKTKESKEWLEGQSTEGIQK